MDEARDTQSWRAKRRSGMAAIAGSVSVSLLIWFALNRYLPALAGMETIAARMLVALKCAVLATLFGLVAGIESVAHERLQGPSFDPLAGYETKRLRVNLRYLQNTLEELIVFLVGLVGLFGLAAYSTSGEAMRTVPAATVIWIVSRYAFWIGYHRSATMRALGAPSLAIGPIMLLYVTARIGGDLAGPVGAVALVAAYLAVEAVLFWKTRDTSPQL